MRVIKKTILTAAVAVFSIALCLLLSVLVLAACSEKVTLRFETYGGTFVDSVEGKVGTAYTVPEQPQKEGYYFEGWYLSDDFSGPPQELPAEMPEESRTYYAKYARYPVLHLLPEGGSVAQTTHLIKPGVNLFTYLNDYAPEKSGFVFGGWFDGDAPLEPDRVMSEEDLTLKARYKARYQVNVYLQNADQPEQFDQSEELSQDGLDWEGETLRPVIQPPEHFFTDESREQISSCVLSAGENVLNFYYVRKSVNITYRVCSREGEEKEFREETRYGATIVFPESPVRAEEREFFGWAREEQSPSVYLPRESMIMGADDAEFFGTWGKKYIHVRGEGYLLVEDVGTENLHQAIFEISSERKRGTFDESTQTFELNDIKGRLDRRGGCLLDDSGVYLGYRLREGSADEAFGKLTLDFSNDAATYESEDGLIAGNYGYEFDEANNSYTGKYVFENKETTFRFTLDKENDFFLKEGNEKGSYSKFADREEPSSVEEIILDGFGAATVSLDGETYIGTYRGSGLSETEWLFESDLHSFRFVACEKIYSAKDQTLKKRVFLIFDEALSGIYEGAGTLTLDGYGLKAEYFSETEGKITGAFTREGNIVTIHASTPIRLTLCGQKFVKTSEEAGTYDGERGTLCLDGAGFGTLDEAGKAVEGSYQMLTEHEIEWKTSTGESLRLRLREGGYDLFRANLYGKFEGSYFANLSLDGYGGGVYTSIDSKNSFSIQVGHFDGEFLQIFPEGSFSPLYFQVDSDRRLFLLQGVAVGKYLISENGELKDDYLFLYEKTSGKLVVGGKAVYGKYTLDAAKMEIVFTTDGGKYRYRLFADVSVPYCLLDKGEAVYEGKDGTLRLDGFKTAQFVANGQTITGQYVLTEAGAEMVSGNRLIRFVWKDGKLEEAISFLRYRGEDGDLYLEENGARALFRQGKSVVEGEYAQDVFRSESGLSFSFKCFQETYRPYDREAEKTLSIEGGGTLKLDGCGNAVLMRDDLLAYGTVVYEGDVIVFSSESLTNFLKTRAFLTGAGEIRPLGEEYGTYRKGEETLALDGAQGAVYCGLRGSYSREGGDEFLFTSDEKSFRFRILRKDGAYFEIFSEELEKRSGTYTAPFGALVVSGWGAVLTSEDGRSEDWNVLLLNETCVAVESPAGEIYLVYGEEVVRAVEIIAVI